jgi:hypothetical protein
MIRAVIQTLRVWLLSGCRSATHVGLGIFNCPLHFAKLGNFQGIFEKRNFFLSTHGGTIREREKTSNNEHPTPNAELNTESITTKYTKYPN